jgi:hypothetical protein
MSGVNYANSSVHKSDLQLIENYAVSLSGGGGGGAQHEYAYAAHTSNISVPQTTDTTAPISSITNLSSKFTLTGGNTLVYSGGTKTYSVNLSGTFQGDAMNPTTLYIRVNVLSGVTNATIPGSSCSVVAGGSTVPPNPAVVNFDSVSVQSLQNGDQISVKMTTTGGSGAGGALQAASASVGGVSYSVPSLRLMLREIK